MQSSTEAQQEKVVEVKKLEITEEMLNYALTKSIKLRKMIAKFEARHDSPSLESLKQERKMNKEILRVWYNKRYLKNEEENS